MTMVNSEEPLKFCSTQTTFSNYVAALSSDPAHPAFFTLILSLGCKDFISASPSMQWHCRLVIKKKVLWTHKFAVGTH